MKATVPKWGNGAAVREEAGRVVIEPVRQITYDPDDLLKGRYSEEPARTD